MARGPRVAAVDLDARAGRLGAPAAPAWCGSGSGAAHPHCPGRRRAGGDQSRRGQVPWRRLPDHGDLAPAPCRAPPGEADRRAALRDATHHRRCGGRAADRAGARGSAAERHPLEHARPGAPHRHGPDRGQPHLARLGLAAASRGRLRAVVRSRLCPEGARHRRPLPGSAGPRPRAVRGREAADPGDARHGAGIPAAARPSRAVHAR